MGRGILLDFHTWRLANNISYEPFQTGSIPLEYLKATAEAQGLEIKFADILIIRSGKFAVISTSTLQYVLSNTQGFMATYNALQQHEIEALARIVPPQVSGVEQSDEMMEWFWENFSAVAGDQPAFECWRTSLNAQVGQ